MGRRLPAPPHPRAFTQFTEAKLYWEYARCYERRAALHYKKRKAYNVVSWCCVTKGSRRSR